MDELNVAYDNNQKADYTDIFFPSMNLHNGQQLTIQYTSGNCFYQLSETMQIKKTPTNYILTYQRQRGANAITLVSDSVLNLSFASSLETFSTKCKNAIKCSQPRKDSGDSFISTKWCSLKICDGLHVIDVPIDETCSNYALSEILNQHRILKSTGGNEVSSTGIFWQ